MNKKKETKYKRVLIKISGESFSGVQSIDLQSKTVKMLTAQLKSLRDYNVQISIIIGGGNIWRGSFTKELNRVTSDYMGMLATMINALALQSALENNNIPTRVQSAIEMQKLAEPYIRRRAVRHLEKGRVVIFACGTGNPFFTTDTAAVLRAAETGSEVILKATKVDGVYSDDPNKNIKAKLFEKISFQEAIVKELKIMDATAFSLCREKQIPVIVFNMGREDNIVKAIFGEPIGTLIHN
ncbi:UMP kinase [bacterium]